MTSQTISPVQALQYPQGAGVTTSATAQPHRSPYMSRYCILVVRHPCFSRPILFRIQPDLSNFLLILICHLIVFVLTSRLALGDAWGFREGVSRPLAMSNTRLRINSVLNSVTPCFLHWCFRKDVAVPPLEIGLARLR